MDVFSLGCIIAEIFNDGVPLFTRANLSLYWKDQYDPTSSLLKLEPEI